MRDLEAMPRTAAASGRPSLSGPALVVEQTPVDQIDWTRTRRGEAPVTPASSIQANWVSVVSHLDPKYGGLSAAVPALSSAVAATGRYSVTIAGFCQAGEHFRPQVSPGVALRYLPVSRLGWAQNGGLRREFRQVVRHSAGVHVHGLWQMSTTAAARLAKAEGKPAVISAHGMLESWALAHRGLKKKIYAALLERRNLQAAACLHALTQAEASDYRHFGLTNPIAIIPNGVDLPAAASPDLFFDCFPALRGRRLVLFLGRIHFKKGLDLLAEAWARLSASWPDTHLVLAGPDFENTQAQIAQRLADRSIAGRATFTGMLQGDLKWSALAAAECFVLPSYSEGLSVSVLEAMGMGKPVVVTKQCNLPEVAQHACGLVIDPEAGQLESALGSLLGASARERGSFGKNGARLVAERYSWPAIGGQMAALYDWLGGGPRPTGFRLDEGHPQ